jgi:hypothetical protein
MWPFTRKPVCTFYRSLAVITNVDVYVGVLQALREAGLNADAEEFADQWDNLTDRFTGEEFAQATKRLAERYVRVRVV